jgi:hypothetical protein
MRITGNGLAREGRQSAVAGTAYDAPNAGCAMLLVAILATNVAD